MTNVDFYRTCSTPNTYMAIKIWNIECWKKITEAHRECDFRTNVIPLFVCKAYNA
jgi:hypothetical protein